MRWQDIEAHNARVHALDQERFDAFCAAFHATRTHQHRSMRELTEALRVVNGYLREEFVRREEDRNNND